MLGNRCLHLVEGLIQGMKQQYRLFSTVPRHGPLPAFYGLPEGIEIDSCVAAVNRAQSAYQAAHAAAPSLVDFLRSVGLWNWMVMRLTHTSNALEGNTLSEEEVVTLLTTGATLSGKSFDEQADIFAHRNALEEVASLACRVTSSSSASVGVGNASKLNPLTYKNLLKLHALAIPASKYNLPGCFRTESRVTFTRGASGGPSILLFPPATWAAEDAMELMKWIAKSEGTIQPLLVATVAHYNLVRAHPFGDGNGRMARLLSATILLRAGFFPALILPSEKHNSNSGS
jgi:Fic family protein